MRFKVDENLPVEAAALLRDNGYDAETVLDEGLGGHPDSSVSEVCTLESRALLTLDLHFSNIIAYPPDQYAGIIVIRSADQSKATVLRLVRDMVLPALNRNLMGHLWIVQKDGIRLR